MVSSATFRSVGHAATIHRQGRAGDERCLLGSQEQHRPRNLLRPSDAAHRPLGSASQILLPGQPPPSGILRLLDHYGIETRGAFVVVVGRSFLVGRPLAILLGLKGRDATVALAHTATRDLPGLTRRADILVAAAGVRGLIGPQHIRPGATVVDVGVNQTESGLVGDVDFAAAAQVAGAITPVPGGVGPMTIAGLLENTVTAAEGHAGR